MSAFIDITGKRYGQLEVLRLAERRGKNNASYWWCKCSCGNEKIIQGSMLKSGNTKSCGHLKLKHGEASSGKHTREYRCWEGIRQRCHNPNNKDYKNYGARGIRECDRWQSFENFLEDILRDIGRCPPGYTIERVDNNRGYEPGNCKWETRANQNKNKRMENIKRRGADHPLFRRNTGEKNAFFGKRHSEETKQKLRNAALKQMAEQKNPMLGKQHSEETKRKIRLALATRRRKKIQDVLKLSS
jgi:hypothetical protein